MGIQNGHMLAPPPRLPTLNSMYQSSNGVLKAGFYWFINCPMFFVPSDNISLIHLIAIFNEGLQKSGLKSISTIYSFSTTCSKLWNYQAKESKDITHLSPQAGGKYYMVLYFQKFYQRRFSHFARCDDVRKRGTNDNSA